MSDRAKHLTEARRLLAVARDFNRGLPELRKRNPALYRQIRDEQEAVAACRRRAATNRELLDMRLD